MSRDRRGDRTQEVIGSIPFSSTIPNDSHHNVAAARAALVCVDGVERTARLR